MEFNISFLPARYGDSIWIQYGQNDSKYRILIDGGTGGTKKDIKAMLLALTPEERVLELLVVTHIDRDHIEGILSLLEEESLPCEIKAIWFNGWPHLSENSAIEPFGAVQGERLTAALLKHNLPWNPHFDGGPIAVPANGPLPRIMLEGGMEIILLSPMQANLTRLLPAWESEVKKAGLAPGYGAARPVAQVGDIESFGAETLPDLKALANMPFKEDEAPANGSSIAFVARYSGVPILLAGDAYPTVVSNSLERLEEDIPFLLAKLSHHGSKGNTSPALMKQLNCNRFVISTNGSIYHHPDAITIARLVTIKEKPELIFNYRSKHNVIWENPELQNKYNYSTIYPKKQGITIPLVNL